MRKEKPKGEEIAEKARKIKLDKEKSVQGQKQGKNVKFTQTELPPPTSMEELEEGQIIGVLENEIEGDETDLPVGKHNLFLCNVNGNWKVYAESNGKVTAEAARVKVERHYWGERKVKKPDFNPEGFCIFNFCILGWYGICLISIGFICF